SDYDNEILSQLNDTTCYERIHGNPIPNLIFMINNKLLTWLDKGLFSKDEYLYLRVDQPRYPCLYTLPKVHKGLPFLPGRPIVSGILGPTEKLSEFVDCFLQPMVYNLPSFIKDTTHILSILNDV
ncbi:hypothetical protein NDU88_005323, partial [Pleurodeles waltl]